MQLEVIIVSAKLLTISMAYMDCLQQVCPIYEATLLEFLNL